MAAEGMDPSLLQDFLTESSELIQQLDADLVTLESIAQTPAATELLNQIFRALHTIKGAGSFLGLTTITTFSHAAEDALNRLRKGEVRVTTVVMDSLLKSVDVIRGMIEQLASGETVAPGPQDLIDRLHAIASAPTESNTPAATSAPAASSDHPAPATSPVAAAQPSSNTPGASSRELKLPPQKVDLLEFMVADLKEQSQRLAQAIEQARNPASRTDASSNLIELAGELGKTAEFFELDCLTKLVNQVAQLAPTLNQAHDDQLDQMLPRLQAIRHLVDQQTLAMAQTPPLALTWPVDLLIERTGLLASGQHLPAQALASANQDTQAILVLDGVMPADSISPAAIASADQEISAPDTDAGQPLDSAAKSASPASPEAAKDKMADAARSGNATTVEQTIRVEVGRLEALMNLCGQMVLTKNRVMGIAKKLRDYQLPHEFTENINSVSNELDRLTSELQIGVMRTRMQPLAKLFERYPRVIRDLARATDKKINLEIVGKETEVDKSVLELLADPLVHILRNSADHGVETPEKRLAAGKNELGTIRLTAEHQGSHVRVEIADDGKGLDREVLGKKAIEKGLTTPEDLAQMSDEEVFRFIFAAGFSTAEKVTDLSGRGVGMDVVRTNIAKMNGVVNLTSTKGKGTTVEILIPLTVAIMPAMVVGVGRQLYCVPLQSIVEIVKPQAQAVHTVKGQPVMRLRDSVLPLIDMRQRLAETGAMQAHRFAVVIGVGNQRAGLMVDRLIGQQEIVIKPLDDAYTAGGPFSGATIREDGDVSLILDVIQLVRQAQTHERSAA